MRYIVATAAVLLGACASPEPAPPGKVAEGKQVCDRDYRTGSNIPTRECRAAWTDEERRDALEALSKTHGQAGPVGPQTPH